MIDPKDLVCMNDACFGSPMRVDLAYARADNLLFGEAIYRADARLFLHDVLAKIVIESASLCYKRYGLNLILYDGLRTVDAQERMLLTQRARDNPQWLEPPRLLSPPGAGGHPRGMAVDIGLETPEGELLDMGTPFDFLAKDPSPEENPAHRNYQGHSNAVYANRALLDDVMLEAADMHGVALVLLPEEWWDFRLPMAFYQHYMPLHEHDLPADMRLMRVLAGEHSKKVCDF